MSEKRGFCPIMSRPTPVLNAGGGQLLENTVECQGEDCELWTSAYTVGGDRVYGCPIVIMARKDATGYIPQQSL